MGSYKWGYKSPNMGYNYSYPTYNPTSPSIWYVIKVTCCSKPWFRPFLVLHPVSVLSDTLFEEPGGNVGMVQPLHDIQLQGISRCQMEPTAYTCALRTLDCGCAGHNGPRIASALADLKAFQHDPVRKRVSAAYSSGSAIPY